MTSKQDMNVVFLLDRCYKWKTFLRSWKNANKKYLDVLDAYRYTVIFAFLKSTCCTLRISSCVFIDNDASQSSYFGVLQFFEDIHRKYCTSFVPWWLCWRCEVGSVMCKIILPYIYRPSQLEWGMSFIIHFIFYTECVRVCVCVFTILNETMPRTCTVPFLLCVMVDFCSAL